MDDTKTFPLRVNERWLDRVDAARDKHESKHEYILKAVEEKLRKDEAK